MEKKEALERINEVVVIVKSMDRFDGKADYLHRMRRLYHIVDIHKPVFNYDQACVNELEELFAEIKSKLKGKIKGG